MAFFRIYLCSEIYVPRVQEVIFKCLVLTHQQNPNSPLNYIKHAKFDVDN